MVGISGLEGLFQPRWFCDFMEVFITCEDCWQNLKKVFTNFCMVVFPLNLSKQKKANSYLIKSCCQDVDLVSHSLNW